MSDTPASPARPDTARAEDSAPPPRPQITLVLVAVFLAYLAQMTLGPVIAPLAREVGLAEWQIGVVVSTAAVMVVLTSQQWGRRSQSWGRKPVLLAALGAAAAAMLAFALLAALGSRGIITGSVLFALFVLSRGVLFGGALAAIAPTAQAYIANVTRTERERVRGMAGVGAVQGIAMVGGSVLGGVLAVISIQASILAVPALLLAGLALVALRLRREPRSELVADPPRIRPLDTRVWPYLLAGFGMFTALGFVQIITGFVVQDRFGLDAQRTGLVTGGALMAAGVGMVIAQAIVVPRTGWAPRTLLRVGTIVAAGGFGVLLLGGPLPVFIAGILAIGLGLGIAVPGYTAGPSLLMDPEEQGGLAGLIGATNGLTFVLAPVASTVLYAIDPLLPIAIGGAIMLAVFAFVMLHPRFRRGGPAQPAAAPAHNRSAA